MTELMPSLCNDCVARNQCGNDDVKMCVSYIKEVKIKCDDCKFVEDCVDYGWEGCKKFTQKQPHTNEEWFDSLTTEEKAEWITNKINAKLRMALHDAELYPDDINENEYMENEDEWVEWLKQPHE